MNNDKIFVVIKGEYDYESSSSSPIYSTFDRAKAEAKVAEMTELKARVLAAKAQIDAHTEAWRQANPRAEMGKAKLKPEPTFPGKKKDWTKEQKDEHKRIVKLNFDAAMEATKPMLNWSNRLYEEYQRKTDELPQDIQDNLLYISKDTQFDIEEVPFEE